MSFFSSVNLDPWHGQSQERSCGLYLSAQPMCGQRGTVGVSKFKTAFPALTNS